MIIIGPEKEDLKKVEIASCMEHSGLVEKVDGLTEWQKTQNGTLRDICKEVKSVKRWIIATLLAILIASGIFNFLV